VSDLASRLAAYAAVRMPDALDVRALDLDRIHGGASRETYRFRLAWSEDGRALERRLILRRDPPGSLIDTDRAVEFAAYRAFHGTGVPVPEALWLEEDARHLDHPFFVMEELSGLTRRRRTSPGWRSTTRSWRSRSGRSWPRSRAPSRTSSGSSAR
jgi:aminoglycoside phosphotransferase (APT) family kinase protein